MRRGAVSIVGLELVVGYLIAWAVAKAKRAGAHLDSDVDLVIDTELDRLHDLVAAKLGLDPAVQKLELAVSDGEDVSERTRRRVEDAVAEAVDGDPGFAAELEVLLARLRATGAKPAVTIGDRTAIVGGDVKIHAQGGSAAALTMGDVTVGTPPAGPTRPGQASG